MKNQNNNIIEQVLQVLEKRMKYSDSDIQVSSPDDSKKYARLALTEHLQEVFAVMFLDNRHCLISFCFST